MSKKEYDKKVSSGIGLGTLIFLIFLTLKLGGWGVVATWSWWWVFSPLWIPIVGVLFILGVMALIIHFLS
jgi:predicted RND superfamily exporter protein